MCHAAAAGDQILGDRIRADADCDFLADRNSRLQPLACPVGLQAFVHDLRDLPQSQFAEGNQVSATKEVPERLLGTVERINVSPPHSSL